MRQNELCLCSCVCTEWNRLISQNRQLALTRDNINMRESIQLKHSFHTGPVENHKVCIDCERVRILVSQSNQVQVFNLKGNLISLFGQGGKKLGQFRNPCGICAINQRIIVADHGNDRIQLFDKDYNPLFTVNTLNPNHICVSKRGNIIVAKDWYEIIIFSDNGSIVKRFNYHENQYFISSSKGVCCNSRDEIMVLDNGPRTILTFSGEGKFLNYFDPKWKPTFWRPSAISIDKDDNFLVGDSITSRVYIFNPEGLLVNQLKVPDIPLDLCLWRRKIIVCCKFHVYIFSNN